MYQSKAEWFGGSKDFLPDTTITPGKLIIDPREPEGPPYLDFALPIPATDLRVTNYPYKNKTEGEKGGSFGVFASILSAVGVGADLSGNLKKGESLDVEVNRLQTTMFDPSSDYLTETLNLPKNLAFLREQRFKRSLYMVTGVKTAYGATFTMSKSREWGGEGKVGISPNVPGLEVGPTGSFTQTSKVTETVGGPTDFVFAFRLNKLHYSRTRSKYVQEKFTKGALYSDTWDENEDDPDKRDGTTVPAEDVAESEGEEVAEVEGLEEEDAGEAEFQIEGVTVVDEEDGEPYTIILTRPLTKRQESGD